MTDERPTPWRYSVASDDIYSWIIKDIDGHAIGAIWYKNADLAERIVQAVNSYALLEDMADALDEVADRARGTIYEDEIRAVLARYDQIREKA